MLKNKKFLLFLGAILLLISGAAFAVTLPPRVSWNPAQLNPASIAPGTSASFNVTLTHTGFLPIPATNQLKVVAEGDIVPFVTFTQPTFPPVFKRGNQVTIEVHISAPSSTAYLRKSGRFVLQRVLPNGTVKEVWRADALPVQFTFSSISLPPYPDPAANNATLEGIDADMNGVRDDIDHYIVQTYPNSAKVREALKQEARALTPFLLDANDREKTRADGVNTAKASNCVYYVSNFSADAPIPTKSFLTPFLNTKERSQAYWAANQKLGGTVDPTGRVLLSEREAHYRSSCTAEVLSSVN